MENNYRNDIPRMVMFDIIQFYNTYKQLKVATYISKEFDSIKHIWVTKNMDTIWQLSEKDCEQYRDTIGMPDYTKLSFYLELINGLLEANPQLSSMKNLIR